MSCGGWTLFASGITAALLLFCGNAEAKLKRRELKVPGSILWVAMGDLDGDRKTDLVTSYRRGSGPKSERALAVFFRNDQGYSTQPDLNLTAPSFAALYDLADVLGGPADDLVFLAPDGVHAQEIVDRKALPPARVIRTRPLVSHPEEEDLVAWDFVRPIAPGELGILVPTKNPLEIYTRKAGEWKLLSKPQIRSFSFYDAERAIYRRSRRGGASGRSFSLQVTTLVPTLIFTEQTGDDKPDLVTTFEDRVAVFPRLPDGTFSINATYQRWYQLRTPEEDVQRDNELSLQVVDVDGDGIADLCSTKIGGGLMNLHTKSQIFRGQKGGGFSAEPVQVFADDGFAALIDFIDVDGDGRPEMLHPESSVSILAMSKVLLSSELSIDFRIRRRSREKALFFEREPVQTLSTVLSLDFSVGGALRGNFPIFGYDFDGDGRRDVLMAQGSNQIVLHRGLSSGGDLFEEDGAVSITAPATREVYPFPITAGERTPPDLLLVYPDRAELNGVMIHFLNENRPRN